MGDSLTEDVATEDRALAHYAQTLELVGDTDPELTRLIERIVADERSHRSSFERLAAQVRAGGEQAYAAHPLMGPEDLAVVGPTIAVEYMTLLQYLWNKYGCGDCEEGEEYFELAVDEMRHLGWAASYVPGLMAPRPPDVPADKVKFVGSTDEAHELARAMEEQAGEFYAAKVTEAKDPALARDLARAAGQHEYHRYRIGRDD
jgi:rubrerythrin